VSNRGKTQLYRLSEDETEEHVLTREPFSVTKIETLGSKRLIPSSRTNTTKMIGIRVLRPSSLSICIIVIIQLLSGSWSSVRLVGARAQEPTFSLPVVPSESLDSENDKSLSSLLKELDAFIANAVSYLINISHTAEQDPKFPGRFTYQADLRKALDHSLKTNYWKTHEQPDYNLLRHNGAIYALSQVYSRNEVRKKNGISLPQKNKHGAKKSVTHEYHQSTILGTMERAVGYLRDNALLPVPDHTNDWIAAWERDDPEDPHSRPDTAKLGGAGLAMIALGRLEMLKPGSVSIDKELRKLGAFVESLQNKKDGSFTCKYHWSDGPDDDWVSLYYPGEAALGLVTLAELELAIEHADAKKAQQKMGTSAELELEHQHLFQGSSGGRGSANGKPKHSARWMKVATNALLYLERLRWDQDLDEIEPDHWALLATERLLPILDAQREDLGGLERKQADLEYWLVYNHGVRVANSIVADHTTKGLEKHKGCFTYDNRTCPTATRLEGLLAALSFIQDSEVFLGGESDAAELLKDRIERDVDMGIRFLLKAQVKNTQKNMLGAVPGMYSGKRPVSNDNSEDEDEDFDLAEVRVDYVQHSLSAVMAYEAFLERKLEKLRGDKAFHEKVHEKVKKVAHHVKRQIDVATASSVFVNYAILASASLFVCIAVCLAYVPLSLIPCLRRCHRRRRRKRRIKRQD